MKDSFSLCLEVTFAQGWFNVFAFTAGGDGDRVKRGLKVV